MHALNHPCMFCRRQQALATLQEELEAQCSLAMDATQRAKAAEQDLSNFRCACAAAGVSASAARPCAVPCPSTCLYSIAALSPRGSGGDHVTVPAQVWLRLTRVTSPAQCWSKLMVGMCSETGAAWQVSAAARVAG